MADQQHVWNYFRAGGVVQVELKTAADLMNLKNLDQKLWMALIMPTRGVNIDSRTLDLIDIDKDGHIRPPELIAAVDWLSGALKDPGLVLSEGQSLSLDQFQDEALKTGAQRALIQIGKSGADSIHIDELDLSVQKLSAEVFNGDSIIVPEGGQDPFIKSLIEDIIHHYASVTDRSGKPGIDQAIIQSFFADLEARANWFDELEKQHALVPFGVEGTALAFQSTEAVAAKIEDYFTRCHWVAYDARAVDAANRQESEFTAIGSAQLNADSGELAALPLAQIHAGFVLPLDDRLNPAWRKPMQYFIDSAVRLLPDADLTQLSESQWRQLQKMLQGYAAWRGREPQSKVSLLDMQKIRALRTGRCREALEELIQFDAALAPEFASLSEVQRALLYRRDLGRILRNFINFSDFYRKRDAAFQTGTLFIDGRATELCVEVTNATRHNLMAGLSGAYLAYCDLHRADSPARTVVGLLTDGDSDNVMVGRNGVFYDKLGRDWDATITRIVANPISLREAFWLPYKKLARFIEEQVAKRAAAAESSTVSDLGGATQTAQTLPAADKAPAAAPAPGRKIDVGTVAAMGVALGSISTFLGLLFSKFLDLGMLMPFGILALIFLVSGPSMVLAWLKLKSRNLGPILDANGWAINTVARINVPFASSMTQLREVPLRTSVLIDPYAEKQRPWRFYIGMGLILLLAAAWALGRLDKHLPEKIRAERVFASIKADRKN